MKVCRFFQIIWSETLNMQLMSSAMMRLRGSHLHDTDKSDFQLNRAR